MVRCFAKLREKKCFAGSQMARHTEENALKKAGYALRYYKRKRSCRRVSDLGKNMERKPDAAGYGGM